MIDFNDKTIQIFQCNLDYEFNLVEYEEMLNQLNKKKKFKVKLIKYKDCEVDDIFEEIQKKYGHAELSLIIRNPIIFERFYKSSYYLPMKDLIKVIILSVKGRSV